MRVLEDSASTSCAIMSEEKSLNETESDGCNSKKNQSAEPNHSPNCDYSEQSYAAGGRLKFFKGKLKSFVLYLQSFFSGGVDEVNLMLSLDKLLT